MKVSYIGFEPKYYEIAHSDLPFEKNIVLKQENLPIVGAIVIDKKSMRKLKREHRKARRKEKKKN